MPLLSKRGPSPNAATESYGSVEAPSKPSAAGGSRANDDLSRKLAAWKQRQTELYGDGQPAATVTVTVIAATGLPSAEPYWIASVNGESAETGLASHSAHLLRSAGPLRARRALAANSR